MRFSERFTVVNKKDAEKKKRFTDGFTQPDICPNKPTMFPGFDSVFIEY